MSEIIIPSSPKIPRKSNLRLKWEETKPTARVGAFLVSAAAIGSGFTWASSQFFQIRGVQDMLTSRIFLSLSLLFLLLGIWGIAWTFAYSKRHYIIVVAVGVLAVIGVLLDRTFPMPPQGSTVNSKEILIGIVTIDFKAPEKGAQKAYLNMQIRNYSSTNLKLYQLLGSNFVYDVPNIQSLYASQEELWHKTEQEYSRHKFTDFDPLDLPAMATNLFTLSRDTTPKEIDLYDDHKGVFLFAGITEYSDSAGIHRYEHCYMAQKDSAIMFCHFGHNGEVPSSK